MIHVSLIGDEGVSRSLGETPRIIERASESAAVRTAARIRQGIITRLVSDMDIPRSAFLRGRKTKTGPKDWTRVKSKKTGSSALVWVGYNPIKAGYVGGADKTTWGGVRQYDWGASSRSYLFPGAFRAKLASGHRGIFAREGATRVMIRGRYAGTKKQPIVEREVRIDRVPIIVRELVAQSADWHREAMAKEITKRLARIAGGQVAAA